jgi:glycerophosphoryl diester phosphodiesterase
MKSNKLCKIYIIVLSLFLIICCRNKAGGGKTISDIKLPVRGLCAHRGAMATYPENTLIAFREAVKAGAHMIEFDVFLSKDQKMVVIHDQTVDRTTNGIGKVSDLTLDEIKKLDAGSWKSPEFAGQKIPTLEEVLEIMPINIWLNIHVKGDDQVSLMVAETLAEQKRLKQAFLACSASGADKAREAVPEIMICNMDRQDSSLDYIKETINMKADFIQLNQQITPSFADYAKILKDNGIRINYYGTDSPEEIRMLFEYGIDFPLVNDIIKSIKVVSELGIQPVKPEFAVKASAVDHP